MKKLLGRLYLIPLFSLLALFTRCAVNGDSGSDTPPYPRQFHVETNRIVDENGTEMVFKGLNPVDPVYQETASDEQSDAYDPAYFDFSEQHYSKMKEWGADIVRLSIEPVAWRTIGQSGSFEILDQAIGYAESNGMYVIIDFHSIGFPPDEMYESLIHPIYGEVYTTTKAEIDEFWNVISLRYKDNDVVAFYEIFNEPFAVDGPATAADWAAWKTYAEGVIDIIRNNDPDSMVIVGGLDHAYDLFYVSENPINKENVVYAAHPYPDKNRWGRSWDDAFGNIKDSYPVFVTEFGFDSATEGGYAGDGEYRNAIKTYLTGKNISWIAWSFSVAWTPALLADMDYTPTESGSFFREWLLEQ